MTRDVLVKFRQTAPNIGCLINPMEDQLPTHREQPAVGEGLIPDEIVSSIIGLAKGFGLTTTDEGVEDTTGQLAYLKANGCAEGQ
jgi:EAL domain-containing protein (putative c-di-GMP-specific phosphodiesterase class I)